MRTTTHIAAGFVLAMAASLSLAAGTNELKLPDCAVAGVGEKVCQSRGTEAQINATRKAMDKRPGGTLGHIAGIHGSTQSGSSLKQKDAQKTPTEKAEDQQRQQKLQGQGQGGKNNNKGH